MVKEIAEKPTGKLAKKPIAKVRHSITKFLKEMLAELKKVTWPSKKDLINYTIAVIVLILIFALVIGVVDLGLTQIMNLILK